MNKGIRYEIKNNGEVHVAHLDRHQIERRCDKVPNVGDQLVRIGKKLVPALVDEETINKIIQEESQAQTELRLVFRTDQLQEYRTVLDTSSWEAPLPDAAVEQDERDVQEDTPAAFDCSEEVEEDAASSEASETVQELKDQLRQAHATIEQQELMMERQKEEYEEELSALREESFKRVQHMQDDISHLMVENASMRKDLEQMNETFRTALSLRSNFSSMSPCEKSKESFNYINNKVYYIRLEDGRELTVDPETGKLIDSTSLILL